MTEKINTKTIIDFLSGPKVKPRGAAGDRIKGLLANPDQWTFQPFSWPKSIKDVKGEDMAVADFEHSVWPVGDGGIMILFPGDQRLGAYCETVNSSRSKAGLAIRCSQSYKSQPEKFGQPIGTQDRCFLLGGNFFRMDKKSLNKVEHQSQADVKAAAPQIEAIMQSFNRWQAQVNAAEEQAASIRLRVEKIKTELGGLDHKGAKLQRKLDSMEARSVKLNSSPETMARRSQLASSYNQAQAAVEDAREAGEATLVKLRKKLDELQKPIPMPAELKNFITKSPK